jgi:DNA-binding beta-propeller fold protein YncE
VLKIIALLAFAGGAASGAQGPNDGKPAPVNPYNGMQEREEVFEFAEKPKVTKQGDRWIITFASKGKCDATVSIVDKDRKVIRHLASGVLGKNAPWPFQQDSLSQKIEWDGKDDFGKPAPSGCRVRVGLGVKFTYERSMGWSPDSMAAQSFAVGKDGRVYCVSGGSIRVFDRNGKYIRTLMPPPGGLKPEDYGAFQMIKTKYGDYVFFSDWMGPFSSISGIVGGAALTPDGSWLLFYSAGDPYRDPMQLIVVNTRTGAIPNLRKVGYVTDSSGGRPKAGVGIWGVDPIIQTTEQWPRTRLPIGVSIAVAPDGDTVYFSGIQHAVYRKKLSEMTLYTRFNVPMWGLKPVEVAGRFPEVFLGERDKAGSDEKHFNRTTGIACDKDGNIYVGDWWNNRIQVFKSDGSFIKSLPANRPGQIVVHPKTGEVYYADTTSQKSAVVKLGGLTDPTVRARFDAPYKFKDMDRDPAISPALGLDGEVSPSIVWFGVGEKVYRLLDMGTTFEKSAEIVGTSNGVVYNYHHRLAVDIDTEALYYSSGSRIASPPWYRFDGKTGKRDESFKTDGWEDMAIAADGTIHCRTGGYGRFVVRFDRDWKPLPFKRGVPPVVKVGQPYAGEPPAGWPANGKAIYTGVGGHSNVWQPGIAVGVNGDVYVRTQGITQPWYERRFPANKPLSADEVEAKWAEDMPIWGKTPSARGGGNFNLVSVWDRDGNEKAPSVIDNLPRGATVAVDVFGNVYVGCGNVVKGGWTELEKENQPSTYRSWGSQGSIFKFVSLGGKFPLGNAEGNNFKDAVWSYTGHAPCCPQDCGCALSVFTLDLHGRLYVPAMQLYSVMVLDANGNKIVRLGRYGNADCQGKDSLVPEPDIGLHWVLAVAASDRALYISDQGNKRIIKANLSYEVEETLPLP